MRRTYYLFILLSLLFIQFTNAQTGKLTGVVKDGEYNDILPFANVTVKGTDKGTTSDFEGAYDIQVPIGTHAVVFSFVGYQDVVITDVVIKEDEVTRINATLLPEAAQLDEVVITASTAKNTEASLINIQKKSVNLMDGISVEGLLKTGAGNVASAVKSIPGVSVQGGKYVYVRGLGDRYTKSLLNGLEVPGLDPDRNTIQMDIFPTEIIDNIQVVKSATADLPADFTGGLVDIKTKDFPVKKTYSFSIGTGYNPDMHLNDGFLTADGSSTDFLGFDNGFRDMPVSRDDYIPPPAGSEGDQLTQITKLFNPNLSAHQATSMPDFSLSTSYGNHFEVGNTNHLGILATLSYKNSTTYQDAYESGVYQKAEGEVDSETGEILPSRVYELQADKQKFGGLGKNKVLLSGLAGITYKRTNSKFKLNFLHIQNGQSEAGYLKKRTLITNAQTNYEDYIGYTQRSISNAFLSGKHAFKEGEWYVEWKVSPTLSKIQDKDIRITQFQYFSPEENGGTASYVLSNNNPPKRLWRNLDEINLANKLDIVKKHNLFSFPAKLKFGAAYVYKQRDYSVDNYKHIIQGGDDGHINGNADLLLTDAEIWNPESDTGTYVSGNYQIVNTYQANSNTKAAYVSEEFKFSENFKGILGVRLEQFQSFYTGETVGILGLKYDNEKVIDKLNLFPSLNLIYELTENSKFRTSYSKTTARPSFKEVSIAQIYDPVADRIFIGNIDVEPSYIENVDLRFETFGKETNMFAISAFYKYFKNPIELSIYSGTASDQYTARNVENGTVYGVELEVRKDLSALGLKHFSLNLNASYIRSIQKMDKSTDGEYESRLRNAREGEEIKDTRVLQGQSPYLINTGITYNNKNQGIQSTLYYNVQGKTLKLVGISNIPDIYTMPFNNLSFNISKTIGKENRAKLKVKVSNLLNDDKLNVYQSYKAEDQLYEKEFIGRTFSLSYSYKF